MVTPGRCDPRWVTLAESDLALCLVPKLQLGNAHSGSSASRTSEPAWSSVEQNAVSGRRSRASRTAYPSWSLGTSVTRCFHFTVTPGRCDPRWVTLAESDLALVPKLQLGNAHSGSSACRTSEPAWSSVEQNAGSGRRSRASRTAYPSWSLGTRVRRCFHFMVTPGRCDPRWVTLAESDLATLNPALETSRDSRCG